MQVPYRPTDTAGLSSLTKHPLKQCCMPAARPTRREGLKSFWKRLLQGNSRLKIYQMPCQNVSYSCSFRSSFSLEQLGRGCCGVNSWQFVKKWRKSKYLQAVSCWLGKKRLSSLLCLLYVSMHWYWESFLGDNVTKLIMVNIAIIKSGHNLSSYLKKLRCNLHTVEMQRYGSVNLPNADTCVIHILCQDSKHFHLSGKFPRTSAQASSAPSTLHSHPCSSRQPLLWFLASWTTCSTI